MDDFKKLMVKFLDRYLKDLSYYAEMTRDGCVKNIFVFNQHGSCILYTTVNLSSDENEIKVTKDLFSDMIHFIGNETIDPKDQVKMYFQYMRDKFFNKIKDYVNKNDCENSHERGLNNVIMSSSKPYIFVMLWMKWLDINHIYDACNEPNGCSIVEID